MTSSWNVNFVPQTTGENCWAACVAMLVNFRDGTNFTDADIVQQTGLAHGASDDDWLGLMGQFHLTAVPGSCMTPEGWEQLIGAKPTIVGITGHVVVACATNALDDPATFQVCVNDPYCGQTWWTFDEIESKFELRANREIHMVQAT